MPDLMITLPDGRTMHHRLVGGPAVIGRDLQCEVTIDDPSTSRRHARLVPADGGYRVEDMGSRNGTQVNEAPATNARLKDGDRITVGAAVVVFREARVSPGTSVIIADESPTSHATRYVPREQRLALSQRRLEMIYELSDRLTKLQTQAELFENAMSICFEMLQFERGAIGVKRRGTRAIDWPVVRNLRGREGELTISRSLLSRALEHGERAMFADDGTKADPTVSMVQHGIRSAMCVPLLHGDDILGVIYGDRTSTSTVYSPEDIDFFAAIARQLSIGLVNAHLMDDQRQMALLSHDLDVARNIQTSLFPAQLPKRDGLSFGALNDPGRRVSGDYYDVIERADGRVWFLIADVTGEGVSAAMLMANLQAAVRVTINETDDPGLLLTKWNKLVCLNAARARFITALLALVDEKTRKMRVGNAGHWPPIQIREGLEPVALEVEGGFPLGVDESAEFDSVELDLGPGPSTLLSFTDGVIEAINTAGEIYGHDRLLAFLGQKAQSDPQAMVKAVRKDVSDFAGEAQQSDDITMVGLRIE